MLWPKLQRLDLNNYSNLDSTPVVFLGQSMDASSGSQHGFIPKSDTSSLTYSLAAGPAQPVHAPFGTVGESPGMRFDFVCWACFVMHRSCSWPSSYYCRTSYCFWMEPVALYARSLSRCGQVSCWTLSGQIDCSLGAQMSLLNFGSFIKLRHFWNSAVAISSFALLK